MMEGIADVPPPSAAAYLPEAASVFDAATALDTAMDMIDPQPTLVELLVRHVLLPCALLPQIEINSNLLRIDFVVFRLATVDGFHIEGMAEDEGNAFLGTEVGEPVPGEDTFDRHDKTIAVGGNRLEKRFRGRLHILVQHDFPVVVHDTDVHTPGMQVDTTVKWVLLGVESHEVSSSLVKGSFPTASIPPGYAEGEASIIIIGLPATTDSLVSLRGDVGESPSRRTRT
jgi:hypothetical protein